MKIAKASDWTTQPMPKKCATFTVDRSFNADEMDVIRRGVRPAQMEDKWFIYWHEDTLYFHRSWTGYCIFVAKFEPAGDGYRMVSVDVNRDDQQYGRTDNDEDTRLLISLIDRVVLRERPSNRHSSIRITSDPLEEWHLIGRAMLGQHPEDERQSSS